MHIDENTDELVTNIEYPIRVNKYLHARGFCSRRQADEMIERGLVTVNGVKAVLGQKIQEKDVVELDSEIKRMPHNYEYFIFYKPRGVVSHSPQLGEKSVDSFFNPSKKLMHVGRLDKDSEGLMLMTSDGRIIDKLLNPEYEHEKEYVVKVDKEIKESFENKMSKGVRIEDYMTKPCTVKVTGDRTFKIILTEGKKHQIRRMCVALGYQIKDLKRTRIMNLRLGGLFPGQSRALYMEEKVELLKSVGLM